MPTNLIVRQGVTGAALTPSDAVDIVGATANSPAALFVGVGGDVSVITLGGSTLVYKNIASGTFMPIQVTRLLATNTTATNILSQF